MKFTLYITSCGAKAPKKEIIGIAFDIDGVRHCSHDVKSTNKSNEYVVITSNTTKCDGGPTDWEVLCKEWCDETLELELPYDKGTGDVRSYNYYYLDIVL